jgi:hypothetical protein
MAQTATIRVFERESSVFPRAAIIYAVQELARRAGVTGEDFKKWRIEFEDDGFVSIHVKPGTNRRIRFPQAGPQFWEQVRAGQWLTCTATWRDIPSAFGDLIPDFRIPFSTARQLNVGPLFASVSDDCIDCPVDLLASIFLTLTRFEETLPTARDEHGRFTAFSSVAWRGGFLHRPVVDEYGLGLAAALPILLPEWQPRRKRLRVSLGYDVDEIGLPINMRTTVGHIARRGKPFAAIRDLAASCIGTETTYQKLLRKLVEVTAQRGLKPSLHWKAAAHGIHDTGYDLCDPRLRSTIAKVKSQDVEMGIHPSYASYESRERFEVEVATLRDVLGESHVGGRQDYLRWDPQSWVRWDEIGLAYDSSVGFADHVGFRAGTCYPFRPWLLSQKKQAQLVEIPIWTVDSTLRSYMKLDADRALEKMLQAVRLCRALGGVFALAWHNTFLMDPGYARAFVTLLDELAGSETYDWRTASDDSF